MLNASLALFFSLSLTGQHSSTTGIVNVYGGDLAHVGSDSAVAKADAAQILRPLRTMENLTTAVTTMRYNHDGQMLAFASRNKKDALKMVSERKSESERAPFKFFDV